MGTQEGQGCIPQRGLAYQAGRQQAMGEAPSPGRALLGVLLSCPPGQTEPKLDNKYRVLKGPRKAAWKRG